MFSGDSADSQGYTQWPLNASAYQSVQSEQVDWAALAHQWIKMKDAGPPPQMNVVPPPPPIINAQPPPPPMLTMSIPTPPTIIGAAKGEAPMEMDDSDSNDNTQQHWGTSWGASTPAVTATATAPASPAWPPAVVTPIPLNKPPLLPTPTHSYTTYNNTNEDSFSPKQHWHTTGNGNSSSNARNASSQQRMLKPHNKRFSKVNVPLKTPHPPSIGPQHDSTNSPTPTIDANKRKQLPAWIREGLEKMERDKLREMDKFRKERVDDEDDDDVRRKLLREDALAILKSSRNNKLNDESGDNDDDNDDNTPPSAPIIPRVSSPSSPIVSHEEMMLKVRRTMTEILLKVTNREIAQICKEEQQRHARKFKAYDQRIAAPSAGANLSARLGLGAYGSGESSDESEIDEERNEIDSDNDLRETIKRRKEAFEKVENEIEERLAEFETEKTAPDATESKSGPASSSSDSEDSSSKNSSTLTKSQDFRSNTPRMQREKTRKVSRSSTSPPSSSSPEERRRRRRRSRSRTRSSSSRRSSTRRRRGQQHSRSRSRSHDRRAAARSRHRHRRRTRSRTRSRSRSSYDGGRGKRHHKR